jgi:OPA family sugar phosphate sensor protein UhpC-like MFS transporter
VKILNIFKPAPNQPEMQDELQVTKSYNYWRWRIFSGMYIGYIFYYFTRKSFTCVMPILSSDLGLSKSDLGILGSVLALTYGFSKFLSGILADRSNPRVFMALGLILTGVFNILFGASSSILWFAIFWGLNGWFQGWGWPPCAKLLTHWYSQKERGTWWGMWNSSHNVGGAVIPVFVAFCAQYWGWRYGMYVPGLLCILVGLFLLWCLRDTPQSLGLPPIEKFKNDYSGANSIDQKDISVKDLLFKYVLNNGYIWVLAIAYFFVYVIRGAINEWTPFYLIETKQYELVTANIGIVWFEIGGLFGSLVAGWASDRIFGGRRGPISAIFSFLVIVGIAGLWLIPPGYLAADYALIFLIGFLIFGPQMLIGMAAAELSHKKAAGSATGFIGWIAYLGSATAGYPLAKITEIWGWKGCFYTLGVCGLIAVVLLLPFWSIKSNPNYLKDL